MFHKGVFYPTADAHAHIYPGKIAEKATGSVGDFYHIPMQNVGLPHVLAQRGAQAGIDRFLVCSVATKVEQVRSINQFIEDKCRKVPPVHRPGCLAPGRVRYSGGDGRYPAPGAAGH